MKREHTPPHKMDEDWSDDMITWSSRRYYIFLKNLRSILRKQPEHVKKYLKQRPWLHQPKEQKNDALALIEKILTEKYPHTPRALQLKHALTQKATGPFQ
jgi:hypothetical protein